MCGVLREIPSPNLENFRQIFSTRSCRFSEKFSFWKKLYLSDYVRFLESAAFRILKYISIIRPRSPSKYAIQIRMFVSSNWFEKSIFISTIFFFAVFLIPQRWVFAIMGFLAVGNAYTMRVCLNLAITVMSPKNLTAKIEVSIINLFITKIF